jgi:hypothetical protein
MGGRQHLAPVGEREDGQGVLLFGEQPPTEDKPQVLPAIASSSALEALLVEQLEALAPEDEDGYRGRLAILAEAVALGLEDCMGHRPPRPKLCSSAPKGSIPQSWQSGHAGEKKRPVGQ